MQKRKNIRAWFEMHFEWTSDDVNIASDHNDIVGYDINFTAYVNYSKRWWD